MQLEIPVYYILIATRNPSFRIASCTWPMLAAANGYKLISLKCFYQSCPYSLARFWVTCFSGIISASDLAFSIASLIIGGSTDSSPVLSTCPILRAPPLIFLKLLANLFAFLSLSAYLASPSFPLFFSSSFEIPTFYLIASAIVPPIS